MSLKQSKRNENLYIYFKNIMKYIFTILFVLLIATAFASDSDQDLYEKIVGVWLFKISEGDMYIKATEEYKNDGTVNTYGEVFLNDELVEEYKVKSRWKVVDGFSHVEILESDNEYLKPGLMIKDKIISVNEKEFTFESDDGKQTTIFRVN